MKKQELRKNFYKFLKGKKTWQIKYQNMAKPNNFKNLDKEEKENTKMIENEVKKDWVPSGHFYSPIPSSQDITERFQNIDYSIDSIKDVDLNTAEQLKNLDGFAKIYDEFVRTVELGVRGVVEADRLRAGDVGLHFFHDHWPFGVRQRGEVAVADWLEGKDQAAEPVLTDTAADHFPRGCGGDLVVAVFGVDDRVDELAAHDFR